MHADGIDDFDGEALACRCVELRLNDFRDFLWKDVQPRQPGGSDFDERRGKSSGFTKSGDGFAVNDGLLRCLGLLQIGADAEMLNDSYHHNRLENPDEPAQSDGFGRRKVERMGGRLVPQ